MLRTFDHLLETQKTEPVYLTNGCCESCSWGGNDETYALLLENLRLWFSATTKNGGYRDVARFVEINEDEDFYPLTKKEQEFLCEDYASSAFGGASMAYSVLYQNAKWLNVLIQVCFKDDDGETPFSPASYGKGEHALCESPEAAKQAALKWIESNRQKIEAAGATIFFQEYDEDDRHGICLLFPFQVAYKQNDFKGWHEFLKNLLN